MRFSNYIGYLLLVIVALVQQRFNSESFAATPCLVKMNRYEVSEMLNLNGKELRLPDNSTLVVYNGGGFINGRVAGNNVKIISVDNVIFASSVETQFENTFLKSCWYKELLACITGNSKCTIEITEGEYSINNPIYVRITNSLYGKGNVLIKHNNSFSVGDDVTIQGISWDGQNKAEYWMYCQPNHMIIRNCSFKNYYGRSAGIIYWSHSERDTEGLLVENCTFGMVGSKENGVIGDMEGSSTVIYTYRCSNVTIRNNRFKDQYGNEDSDAIKMEGVRVDTPEHFPLPSGEDYRYGAINAIVEGNEFVDVPKSPVKVFASKVTIRSNKMSYSAEVKTAIARMFRGEDILVDSNVAECADAVSNAIEVHSCRNVRLNKNNVSSMSNAGKPFGELLKIENSVNVDVTGLNITMSSSSMSNTNQSLVRLSGKDITIKNSYFQAPYSYYGVYAPLGIDGLIMEKNTIEVTQGIQYAFLVNNAVKEPKGTCTFNKCTFKLAAEKIDDATSYGAAFAHRIIVKNCVFDYAKGITLNAEKVKVKRSIAKKFNIQERNSVEKNR